MLVSDSDRHVEVLDNLMSQELIDKLIATVSWMPMYFLNRWEQYRSHELDMHWYYPIAFSEQPLTENIEAKLATLDESLKPVTQCWELIKGSYANPVRLYECMISANAFGTEGRPHRDVSDSNNRAHHHTALVYCNKEWDVTWAGETLVFDDHGEITAAVMPKPGRVMKIAGDPLHVGRSVSRICPTDRRVLVFKYWSIT